MNFMTPIELTPDAAPAARAVSLDIRELRSFASVARNGNFGRAARELEIAQTTLSHQLHRLEETVGAALLLRHGRGVTLTAAGNALLERLDAVLHLLHAPLGADDAADTCTGTLCLGIPAELAPVLLPPLLEETQAAWPQLSLEIRELPSGALDEAVLNRRVDVAVLQDPPDFDSLTLEPVVSEPLGLVAGVRARVAADTRPVRLRELSGLPLILPHEQHWIRRRLSDAAFRHGVRLSPVLQLDSLASVKALVRSGAGCAVLPRVAVQEELARGALAFRAIAQPALLCTHAVAVSRTAEAPVVALGGLVRRVMAELAREGGWLGATAVAPGGAAPALAVWADELAASGRAMGG